MNLLDEFKRVRTFVFDVDGVLTDGSLLIFDNREYIRKMNIKDGYALEVAVKKGYRVTVISGSVSPPVVLRLHHLGVRDVFMGEPDKRARLQSYITENNLLSSEILYMGDDMPDYSVMQEVGLPCAPSDAAMEVRQIAKYISPYNGGQGCVRDVIEKVLKLNNQWELHTAVASR